MKFIIDIEDFWIEPGEDETSLSNELKSSIIREIVRKVSSEILPLAKAQIEADSKKQILDQMKPAVEETINDFIKTGKVKGKYQSDPPVTYMQFIEETITNSSPWTNLEKITKKLVEEKSTLISNELKERYDTAFATQIVMKLGANGMLKDDVAKLLLPNV